VYRLHKPDPGPEPLKEVLARLFTARGWGRRQARLHLERAWTAAVGSEYVAHTRVLGLRRGVFEIEVNSAAMLQELAHFHKQRLLKTLRATLPGESVKDLRFRAGSWEN
jgi:predicted nucleic acid-binding Zn ribbon protein